MAIQALTFAFNGSFQVRLATDPDPTDSSPNGSVGYSPQPSRPGVGWTFDFDESRFDRIVRLSRPVDLRTGLMAGWIDARVIWLRVNRGAGFAPVAGDPLVGQVVSLGSGLKLDAAAGGGATHEAFQGLEVGVGTVFKAGPKSPTRIDTDGNNPDGASWEGEYKTAKQQRRAQFTNPVRQSALDGYFDHYARVFGRFMGKVDECALNTPVITPAGGVLAEVAAQMAPRPPAPPKPGRWQLHFDLYRFDPDTLVGTVNGWVDAAF